nr:PREDICTED: calpain-3-like [Latimeria chalumnae]|eukprot:XP_014350117.1 PREDICTED: calpain-3-like [Latimeria chalumnae]
MKLIFSVFKYYKLVEELKAAGGLWEDPEFPPSVLSLTYEEELPQDVTWIRASEFHERACFMENGVSKSDIMQGELGDCWFWASVATIAHCRQLIERVIPPGQYISEKGPYFGVFQFRFWQFGNWVEVLVDDYLPTRNRGLIYARSENTNEFWPSLLEKAFAK